MKSYKIRTVVSTFLFVLLLFVINSAVYAQLNQREELNIPDIPGYESLACDFHIHTAFSDAYVWPNVRVQEIWRDGLDALSITDHIEYQRFKEGRFADLNMPFLIAKNEAVFHHLLLIRGGEITKSNPLGHINILFLEDVTPTNNDDYRISIDEAVKQGGFVILNHPGQGWCPEHEELYQENKIHGVEIANGRRYYPEAHRWCIEKGLTLMGNTDTHELTNILFDPQNGDLRTMTIVFVKEKSVEGIKDALISRRTAVWTNGSLYGDQKFVEPLFYGAVEVTSKEVTFDRCHWTYVMIHNPTAMTFKLKKTGDSGDLIIPGNITIHPKKTIRFRLRSESGTRDGLEHVRLSYAATNIHPLPGKNLDIILKFDGRFLPIK